MSRVLLLHAVMYLPTNHYGFASWPSSVLLGVFCRIPFKTCESQDQIHQSPKKTMTFVVSCGSDKVVFFKNTPYIVQVWNKTNSKSAHTVWLLKHTLSITVSFSSTRYNMVTNLAETLLSFLLQPLKLLPNPWSVIFCH